MIQTITVEGRPVVTPRPRVLRRGYTYTPARAKGQQQKIAAEWIKQHGYTRHDKAIKMYIRFVFPVPESWTKSKKQAAERGEIVATSHAVGDIDNLIKTVLDGLNNIAYIDDSMITTIYAAKRYARADEEPHTKITIYT